MRATRVLFAFFRLLSAVSRPKIGHHVEILLMGASRRFLHSEWTTPGSTIWKKDTGFETKADTWTQWALIEGRFRKPRASDPIRRPLKLPAILSA